MDRRSLLALAGGVALGWTGATVVGGDDDTDDSAGGSGSGSAAGTETPTPETASATDTPTPEPASTTATPTETATATPEPASPTATATATPTATPESNRALQANLDVYSRGFADDNSYKVLYSIRNENDVTVEVTFEATVSLQNSNSKLRETRTATIEPGQAASDEFVFDEYDSKPTGYGFKPLRTVEA